MNTIIIPGEEATKDVELTLDEAFALAGKKIDYWRNFRTSVDNLRNEQTAYAVVAEDPELTPEEQEKVKAVAAIMGQRSEKIREVTELLKPTSRPKPEDVKTPIKEQIDEEVKPEVEPVEAELPIRDEPAPSK